MMLDLLNKIASMEFPRIQKQNEKLVREYMAESRATPMDQQDLAEEIGIDDGYLSSIISPSKRTRKYRKIIKGRDVLRFASRMFIRKAMESVLKKFKICKIAPNRETSLKLPGTQCLRPFSNQET